MSYILDALKKADAQRERDPARGIHAQPVPPAGDPGGVGQRYRAWFWSAGAVALIAAGAVAWNSQQDHGAVLARSTPPVPVVPVAAAVPVVAPAAAVVAVTAEPAPVATAVMPPAPPPASVVADEEPIREPRNRSVPRSRGRPQEVAAASPASAAAAATSGAPAPGAAAAPAPAAAAAQTAPTPAASASASAAASSTPVPARAPAVAPPPALVNPPPPPPPPPRVPVVVPTPPVVGLPSDAPKLVITGGVYSSNAAQRMLIVNGQVVNQGADLGSGVTLEEIKPKAAVLLFRGSRYSIAY